MNIYTCYYFYFYYIFSILNQGYDFTDVRGREREYEREREGCRRLQKLSIYLIIRGAWEPRQCNSENAQLLTPSAPASPPPLSPQTTQLTKWHDHPPRCSVTTREAGTLDASLSSTPHTGSTLNPAGRTPSTQPRPTQRPLSPQPHHQHLTPAPHPNSPLLCSYSSPCSPFSAQQLAVFLLT